MLATKRLRQRLRNHNEGKFLGLQQVGTARGAVMRVEVQRFDARRILL